MVDKLEEAKEDLKKYAENLGLGQDAINAGYDILDNFQKKGTNDFRPRNLAAGALYMSAILVGEGKTQERIGIAAKISAKAVGKSYRKLSKKIDVYLKL